MSGPHSGIPLENGCVCGGVGGGVGEGVLSY
jgi:hypothetical protein